MPKSTTQLKAIAFRTLAIAVALIVPQIGAFADPDLTDGTMRVVAVDLDHGRKLYELSCDTCHEKNVHWREKSLVDSWSALVHQVNRWQRNASQQWQPADVNDVAAYLNERFYHLACPSSECAAKAAALHPDAGIR